MLIFSSAAVAPDAVVISVVAAVVVDLFGAKISLGEGSARI